LVRQWRGHTHTVLAREDGFEYEGQRYRSLTVIAERITGAHWSGPPVLWSHKRARAFDACLEFQQVIYGWFVEQRPLHMGDEPGERIARSRPRLEHLFKQGQHRVLIEAIAAQLGVLPAPQLELARTHRLPHVDAGFGEPPEMVFPQIGVHEVESFVSPVKALFDERAKHPVLLVHTVKKRANVTALAENVPGTSHGIAVCPHTSPVAATGVCQSRADASEQIILLKGLA
jgi:hypothetical protein